MNIKKKSIPSKNYVFLFLIILGTFLLMYYIYLWYKTYKEEELNRSIISNYLNVINYNEIDNYISENGNALLYVTKIGDKNINLFEKAFKNLIINNDLRNDILYLDVSNEEFNSYRDKFGIDDRLPYIVVYTDGKITNKYNISKNNYNIGKLEKYLNRIGVSEDD